METEIRQRELTEPVTHSPDNLNVLAAFRSNFLQLLQLEEIQEDVIML